MRIVRRMTGTDVSFCICDVAQAHHKAVRGLGYAESANCFVKTFPIRTPQLDRAYGNLGRCAEDMVLQAAGLQPVPWKRALLAFLQAVEGQGLKWWLPGSGALAVRGLDVSPRDLDIVVDDAGAVALGELFSDSLVEPVVPVRDWICNWFGRAFLYARVEWVGGVDPRVDKPHATDYGPTAAGRLEKVGWLGREIQIPPLDLQLATSERLGLTERTEVIRRALSSSGQ